MKIPGTLDSKLGLSTGMSRPRRSVPNTKVMASNGQAVLHAPWPMQSVGPISAALPSMRPSTSWCEVSGQADTQVPHPRHLTGSMTGWSEAGSVMPGGDRLLQNSLVAPVRAPLTHDIIDGDRRERHGHKHPGTTDPLCKLGRRTRDSVSLLRCPARWQVSWFATGPSLADGSQISHECEKIAACAPDAMHKLCVFAQSQ